MDLTNDGLVLLLIVAANGAPVAVPHLFAARWRKPIDGGYCLRDGFRLFGESKTWPGLILGALSPLPIAVAIGWPWWLGALIGTAAMDGDLLASLIKRRLGLPAEARATGLDQVPESLLPALAAVLVLPIGWLDGLLITLAFTLLAVAASPLLYHLHLRRRPY